MQIANNQNEAKLPHRYLTIARDLRGKVQTSNAGDMLPSERELANQYSVSHTTVRKVLDILEQEGCVQRYHGRGTVIVDRLRRGEFAIVIRSGLLGAEASPFYRMTASLLSQQVRTYNDRWIPKLHLGKQVDEGINFPATLDLLDADTLKQLRGVFTFHPLYELGEPLSQRKIPIVRIEGVANSDSDVIVADDKDAFYRETVQHLRKVGCKTVGFVWSHPNRPLLPAEKVDALFAKHAIEAGLVVKEKWMPAITGDITQNKAYELFMKFWEQQADHPDGIVINDDVIASGVLRATMHKQIQIPEQIRLVTFGHKGAELPYHLSVTRYENDLDQIAKVALDVMNRLLQGRTLEQRQIKITGSLIKGQTT
jgi:DNA-binding LacI/PurR family transcriptional regulator